jgi:hypothetical protein
VTDGRPGRQLRELRVRLLDELTELARHALAATAKMAAMNIAIGLVVVLGGLALFPPLGFLAAGALLLAISSVAVSSTVTPAP